MGLKVGDFFIALGFEVDDKTLKDFNDRIKDGTKMLGAMSATAAATAYAINSFVASSVDSSIKLKNLADQTGTATEEVQRFYNVAGRLNTEVTLDQTIGTFQKLADTIAQAKLGQGPLGPAAQLGIANIGGLSPIEIIKQLRANLDKNEASWGKRGTQQLMQALGIGPELYQAIRATQQEFDQLWANPILDGQYRDELVKLGQEQKEFGYQLDIMKGKLSAGISPTLIDFLKNLGAVMDSTAEAATRLQAKIDEFQKAHGGITPQDPEGPARREERYGANAAAVAVGLRLLKVKNPYVRGVGATIILVTGVNDVGKYLRGQPSTIGDLKNGAGVTYQNGRQYIQDEYQKSKEQKEQERQDLMNGPAFGKVGELISKGIESQRNNNTTNNNTMNIYSTGDPAAVAKEVVSGLDDMQHRTAMNDILFNASGMQV